MLMRLVGPSRAMFAIERRLSASARAKMLERIASSGLLSSLYLSSRGTFKREGRAILAGRALHAKGQAGVSEPTYEVRRNTHRLEKGLCAARRRDVFALDYLAQLVTDVETIVTKRAANGSEPVDATVVWSLDTLAKYFEVCPFSPQLERAKAKYERLIGTLGYTPSYTVRAIEAGQPQVTYAQLRGLVSRRQSVRTFEPVQVSHEVLDRAFDLARWSPSACNRLAYEFRVYENPATISAIVELTSGMSGWAEEAPCLFLATGRYRAYAHECDRHLIYVDVGLAAMTLQYALTSLGLASCCGNWPEDQTREESLAELLGLDADEKPVLLIAVGYPKTDQGLPSSARPGIETIRSYR
jgi:nitroreductase